MIKYVCIATLFFSITATAQLENQSVPAPLVTEIISIRPADGKPAVFPSQAELDEKINDKIDKIKQLILENISDPSYVEGLKQELWRFENAIVQPTNTSKL